MTTMADIGSELEALGADQPAGQRAGRLLRLGEDALEGWLRARGLEPTTAKREGFRLLALHRQGAKGDPSFNACRETCRELVYHHNLIVGDSEHPQLDRRLEMMRLVAMHLYLFVSGKMQVNQLGEFCCASKPLRLAAQT
jgi:hypothetical protein